MKKPLLIIAITCFVVSLVTITAVILDKQGKLIPPTSNISEVFQETKDTTITNIEEGKIEAEESQEETKKLISNQSKANWQWVNEQKELYKLTPAEINLILKEAQKRFPNKAERLKVIAILREGTPYQLGCLGEESGRDKDPIFRLDVTDCTAFVLTNVALLHSQTLEEAEEMMKFLNYRLDKNITFENRLHFTTDRNMVSPYFQDITEEVAGTGSVIEKKVILNKIKADGKRIIDIDWEEEIAIKYIPNENITKELFDNLPEAIGIAFIKEEDEKIGLDVRHEGFLFDGEFLFHATSIEKRVVAMNFFEYYFDKEDNPRFDGLILFEIR